MIKVLKKANERLKVAKLAENKQYFNSATSNYYYNIFMRIMHFIKIYDVNFIATGQESHEKTHEKFLSQVGNNLKNKKDVKIIGQLYNCLKALKRFRKTADYENYFITQKDFQVFQHSYNEVDIFLKKYNI